MFAVPGWSVSPGALKTQAVESPKPTVAAPLPEKTTTKSSRKRKYNESSKSTDVTSTNLADLWQAVIEKKPKPKQTPNPVRVQKHGQIQDPPVPTSNNPQPPILSSREQETQENNKELLSKTKRQKILKDKKRGGRLRANETEDTTIVHSNAWKAEEPAKPPLQLTPLQSSMRQKLISARFRHLNQTLYTSPSSESLELFRDNPEMFQEYHEGFRKQVEIWPENPVDGYIEVIKKRGAQRGSVRSKNKASAVGEQEGAGQEIAPLPRTEGTCHIADLGCGDAGISKALEKEKKKLKLHISSFDLQNSSPLVTKADIANLPLTDGSVDAAIFCLALMGTNWIDFIEEAFRILRWKGELWIAEIKSRFGRVGGKGNRVEHSVGNKFKPDKKTMKKAAEETDHADLLIQVDGQEDNKGQTDVSAFVEVLRKRGFTLQNNQAVDLSNKMFVRMSFVKGITPIKGKNVPIPKGMAELGIETWRKKPKGKFIDSEADTSTLSGESAVLKPCVYKLR